MVATNPMIPMPVKARPYDHQYKAFDFACEKFGLVPSASRSNGVALLMEMGTGKTLTSIAILGALYQFGLIRRALVVCPVSIKGVWEQEIAKFAAFPCNVTVLTGASKPNANVSLVTAVPSTSIPVSLHPRRQAVRKR